MASKNITITISPATEDDTLALAHIEAIAFDDPNADTVDKPTTLGRVMFGAPSTEAQSARAKELVARMRDVPEVRLYKAVAHDNGNPNSGDKIIGFGGWRFYTDPHPTHDTWEDKPWENTRSPQACNEFFGGIARSRTKIMGGKRFAWLEILATHPDYQGIGAGGKLIRLGLAEAAKLGLDEAYLEATQAGYPLYKKFGWEDVETVLVDLSKYGGKGIWPTVCMRRMRVGEF